MQHRRAGQWIWVVGTEWGPFAVLQVGESDTAVGEFSEWRVEQSPNDTLPIDVKGRKERLIKGASRIFALADVEAGAVLEQSQSDPQPFVEECVVDAGEFDQSFRFPLLDGQALLALFKVGDWDGLGQISVDQLLSLPFDPLEAPPLSFEKLLVLGSLHCRLLAYRGADGLDQLWRQSHHLPMADDGSLRRLDGEERQVAWRALLVAAEAVKVGVDGAVLARGITDAQPGIAAGAEERAFQVVIVAPGAITCDATPREHILDAIPGFLAHQGWMPAVVLHPTEDQLPDVVRTRQNPVDLTPGERHGGAGRCRTRLHPTPAQLVYQVGDRPLARGVALERPLDVRRAFRIKHNDSDLALGNALARVQIPQRRVPRRATPLRLLIETLLGLVRKVLRIELSHRGQHPVHQRAGRCAVDVLRGRNEDRTGFVDRPTDHHVVSPVPREPIDLVHDYVIDVLLLPKSSEKLLEGRPISGAS